MIRSKRIFLFWTFFVLFPTLHVYSQTFVLVHQGTGAEHVTPFLDHMNSLYGGEAAIDAKPREIPVYASQTQLIFASLSMIPGSFRYLAMDGFSRNFLKEVYRTRIHQAFFEGIAGTPSDGSFLIVLGETLANEPFIHEQIQRLRLQTEKNVFVIQLVSKLVTPASEIPRMRSFAADVILYTEELRAGGGNFPSRLPNLVSAFSTTTHGRSVGGDVHLFSSHLEMEGQTAVNWTDMMMGQFLGRLHGFDLPVSVILETGLVIETRERPENTQVLAGLLGESQFFPTQSQGVVVRDTRDRSPRAFALEAGSAYLQQHPTYTHRTAGTLARTLNYQAHQLAMQGMPTNTEPYLLSMGGTDPLGTLKPVDAIDRALKLAVEFDQLRQQKKIRAAEARGK